VIDCQKVAGYARRLSDVVFATDLMYTCSPDGLRSIKQKIEEEGLNRVVVASGTPRTHESLFQGHAAGRSLAGTCTVSRRHRNVCSCVRGQDGDGKVVDEKE
jgi:heterodisulfide reductase subunit A-like polyferredoxin